MGETRMAGNIVDRGRVALAAGAGSVHQSVGLSFMQGLVRTGA
jgi:hypothetical protein